MKFIAWFKNHRKLSLILAGILVVVGVFVMKGLNQEQDISAAAEIVKKVTLINPGDYTKAQDRIITTGTVQSAAQADIRAQVGGEIKGVYVGIGNDVPNNMPVLDVDTELASIQARQAQASVQQAQAQLDLRIVGASPASIDQVQKAYEVAQTGLLNAEKNLERTIVSNNTRLVAAEKALQQAQNNLQLSENGTASYLLIHTYESIVATMKNAVVVIDETLVGVNSVLGVDASLENLSYRDNIGVLNHRTYDNARVAYKQIKNSEYANTAFAIENLSVVFQLHQREFVDTQLENLIKDVQRVEQLLVLTREVLETSLIGGGLTPDLLLGLQADIDGRKQKINGELQKLNGLMQARTNSQTQYDNLMLVREQAEINLADTKKQNIIDLATAENGLEQAKASVAQAQAGYNVVTETPRQVDLAPLQAALNAAQAQADLAQYSVNRGIVRAPIDGQITNVQVAVGDFVQPGQLLMSIASTRALEIETYVTTDDIKKIENQAEVIINDYYTGFVIERAGAVDPNTNKVKVNIIVTSENPQLVLGEIVRLSIMTVTDDSQQTVYTIPLSAVKIQQGDSFVGLLNNENVIDFMPVEIGNVVGEKIQIIGGLDVNKTIIQSLKGLDAGDYVLPQE